MGKMFNVKNLIFYQYQVFTSLSMTIQVLHDIHNNVDFDSKFLIISVFIVQFTSFAAGIVSKHVNFVFTNA